MVCGAGVPDKSYFLTPSTNLTAGTNSVPFAQNCKCGHNFSGEGLSDVPNGSLNAKGRIHAAFSEIQNVRTDQPVASASAPSGEAWSGVTSQAGKSFAEALNGACKTEAAELRERVARGELPWWHHGRGYDRASGQGFAGGAWSWIVFAPRLAARISGRTARVRSALISTLMVFAPALVASRRGVRGEAFAYCALAVQALQHAIWVAHGAGEGRAGHGGRRLNLAQLAGALGFLGGVRGDLGVVKLAESGVR